MFSSSSWEFVGQCGLRLQSRLRISCRDSWVSHDKPPRPHRDPKTSSTQLQRVVAACSIGAAVPRCGLGIASWRLTMAQGSGAVVRLQMSDTIGSDAGCAGPRPQPTACSVDELCDASAVPLPQKGQEGERRLSAASCRRSRSFRRPAQRFARCSEGLDEVPLLAFEHIPAAVYQSNAVQAEQ